VRDRQAYLIDFQGMRPGLSKYDLASLLYDPYVKLSLGERAELFAIYRGLRAGFGYPLRVDDEEVLRLCALQRLMQALGFYGFAGTIKGSKTFPKYIPAGMESLRAVLREIPGTEKLRDMLANLTLTDV
jgi:N-acetylmuramate 1-kinase